MMEGFVVKIIDSKTVKVKIVEVKLHPLYKKVLKKERNLMCQNNNLQLLVGNKVQIVECKPYSKLKKHIVVNKD